MRAAASAGKRGHRSFEGFDAVPVVESAGFWAVALLTEAPLEPADDLATAMRQIAQAPQAEVQAESERSVTFDRAEAELVDLWVRAGDNAYRGVERPALAASASLHGLMAAGGDLDFRAWTKTSVLRADFIQPDPGNYVDSNGNGQYDEGEEIIVKGTRPKTVDDDGAPWDPKPGDDIGGGDKGGGPGLEPPREPDCSKSNEITGKQAPDGAGKYYVPEDVNSAFLNSALSHIIGISNNNPFNRPAVMAEIIDMYTNPANPFFVDFKDWGTDRGPPGSVGVTWTYFSTAANADVRGSLFEPFGNYFFGMLCTYGGLAPEEIYLAAAWFSESGRFWEGDDPQDIPHVNKGIADAQTFIAGNQTPIQVREGHCGA